MAVLPSLLSDRFRALILGGSYVFVLLAMLLLLDALVLSRV